jgi:NAD-dependent deacetylase
MSSPLEDAAHAVAHGRCVIASTGAGISAESGIPTFRGDSGIWKKYPPEKFATIQAYLANPLEVWGFWVEIGREMAACKPNAAHVAIAEMESQKHLHAVVTQNVDSLHQTAGSQRVIEYHGNVRRLVCTRCRHQEPVDLTNPPKLPPHCPCGIVMRPDIVMFGEYIPEGPMHEAAALAEKCDVMIIVGTSAQVYPAADLPFIAKQHGAFIIESNIEETDFTSEITDAFLCGAAGETLPSLAKRVRELS